LNSTSLITKPLVKAPEQVAGYHGCPYSVAEQILEEQRFLPSLQAYDWLGEGAYFWEFAPYRAREWAQSRIVGTHDTVAVVGATIRLGHCLNLLDTEHIPDLEAIYKEFVESVGTENLPRNTEQGAHFLDRSVIEAYCRAIERKTVFPVETVRGSFPEGGPIYEGSKILRKAHTQIAVRASSCISDLHLVEFI
jgi:hypothetical protein